MVRCFGVLLILALLLSGCVLNIPEATTPSESVVQPEESTSTGLYVPESDLETETNGAIRVFRLEDGGYYGCVQLGKDMVLMRNGKDGGAFTLYHGEYLEEVRTFNLGQDVLPTATQMQISEQGIGYFDSANEAVVFLNTDFVETGRMYLPAEMQGDAWLSPDWKMVYYCTEKGIHAMDLQTGIARLLREQSAVSQEITGGFGNGEILRYVLEITEGQKLTQLIDAATGMVLQEGAYFDALVTQGENYFLPYVDRGVRTLRFGNGEDHQILWPAEETAEPKMLFANQAVVMLQQDESKVNLVYYDLQTGARYAAITLEGVTEVLSLQDDGEKGVWLLVSDDAGAQWLYHWDCNQSLTEDSGEYTAPRYTQEDPDTDGLEAVKKKAAELGNKFGVEILIWKDAAATAPADQFFTEEHVTQLYDYYLPEIEEALSIFPEGFFAKSTTGKLRIALMQKIEGNPAKGTLAETDCLQFWNGNVPVVALTLGEDFRQNLYHGVYLYMEARILSKSSALYEWHRWNPNGFEYDNNYITNLVREDWDYLHGDNRHFIDMFSMSYAKEDRAQIFEYACMPGNEEYFTSWSMQKKLSQICKGIREAYGLKKVETTFIWEQYLT